MSVVARRYYQRGIHALGRNDLDHAVEQFQAAVDLVPTFAAARIGCATALSRIGDAPRAAQTLRAGLGHVRTPSGQGRLWAALGDALLRGGDFLGAEDAYNQAGMVSGFEPRAMAGRAKVYAKLGRYTEAFEQLAGL